MSAMLPVIALVGRPNVGKSTLFNQFTRTRDALVVDLPGTTRDRLYGQAEVDGFPFIAIDTGGVGEETEQVEHLLAQQSWLAVEECDVVLFLVDGHSGLTPVDSLLAQQLRKLNKPVFLVVNKVDGQDPQAAQSEFYRLGLGGTHGISAKHGRGIRTLVRAVAEDLHWQAVAEETEEAANEAAAAIQVAVVGQPNVGKSTLINQILGQANRLVVCDEAGTTRDSVKVPFTRGGQDYCFIDTAGVRRRTKIKITVEKFSVVKSLQAIEQANIVVFLIDATRGVTDQDLSLLQFVAESGRGLVIGMNKSDILDANEKVALTRTFSYRLPFVDFAEIRFISASCGYGIKGLFNAIDTAYANARRKLATPKLTELLQSIVAKHPPPRVQGRRIKLRYAHAGGQNPPRIIIHGNQTGAVPGAYLRYLVKSFHKLLKLQGTPLFISFKTGDNPYEGKINRLTPRQQRKRARMIAHYKKAGAK